MAGKRRYPRNCLRTVPDGAYPAKGESWQRRERAACRQVEKQSGRRWALPKELSEDCSRWRGLSQGRRHAKKECREKLGTRQAAHQKGELPAVARQLPPTVVSSSTKLDRTILGLAPPVCSSRLAGWTVLRRKKQGTQKNVFLKKPGGVERLRPQNFLCCISQICKMRKT